MIPRQHTLMKETCLQLALIGLSGLLFASCDSNDEPAPSPQYRISRIHSEESLQMFEYDATGRISEWKHEDLKSSNMYKSTYRYLDGEDAISIESEEKRGDDTWNFSEKLYLNPDGTAGHAAGRVTVTNRGIRMMTKNYTADFHYNPQQQLTKIDTEEKRIDDYGWEETNGLRWSVELDWENCNLVRYLEYSNPDRPMTSISFTYFGGETAHYIPIVQRPIFRSYYLPLQYQGVLGYRPAGLVKERVVTSPLMNMATTFSYDISASIYNSAVEAYYEHRDGKDIKHTVVWDAYNPQQ